MRVCVQVHPESRVANAALCAALGRSSRGADDGAWRPLQYLADAVPHRICNPVGEHRSTTEDAQAYEVGTGSLSAAECLRNAPLPAGLPGWLAGWLADNINHAACCMLQQNRLDKIVEGSVIFIIVIALWSMGMAAAVGGEGVR